MINKSNRYKGKETEFVRQIEEVDRHIDRGGMLTMMLIVLIIFIIGYWVIDFFSIRNSNSVLSVETHSELIERVNQLEEQVSQLELRLDELTE